MKTKAIMITAGIFGSLSFILSKTDHSILSLWFSVIGILLFLSALFVHRREIKKEKETLNSRKPKIFSAVITDDETNLVIKSISDERTCFKTVQDLIRETNLPLKTINRTIDWLYMNNFVSEEKGRHGKTYILTPEGRNIFSRIIEK